MPEQILRHTDDDGVTRWRDVYDGPQGAGYIDYEERTVAGVTERRSKHTGPEDRQDTNWQWVEVQETSL